MYAADKAAVVNDLTPVHGNFSVPVLIGEYGTSSVGSAIEKAAGWAVGFASKLSEFQASDRIRSVV
jgi:hypothetical protein